VGATMFVCIKEEEKKTACNEPTVASSDFHQEIVALKLSSGGIHIVP
jgi:hypothetical protein